MVTIIHPLYGATAAVRIAVSIENKANDEKAK
jgi:hypothetical protein